MARTREPEPPEYGLTPEEFAAAQDILTAIYELRSTLDRLEYLRQIPLKIQHGEARLTQLAGEAQGYEQAIRDQSEKAMRLQAGNDKLEADRVRLEGQIYEAEQRKIKAEEQARATEDVLAKLKAELKETL